MLVDEDTSTVREVAKAVAIAGLGALATKLAEWAVEAVKARAAKARDEGR